MNKKNSFDMNQYFVRWQDGRLSPSEQETLENWLADSAQNQKVWNHLLNVWKASSASPIPVGTPPDVQWRHLLNRLLVDSPKPEKASDMGSIVEKLKSSIRLPSPAFAVASAVVIMVLIFAYKFYFTAPSLQELTVPFGQQMELVLSDGSEIHLNAGSTFKYPKKFNSTVRKVELEGEAYFKVEPGQVPFVVETSRARTRVLSTEFNIRTWDSATEVFVNSGRVAVHSNIAVQATEVEVLPGQLAICKDGPIQVQPTEHPDDLLSWRHGRLVFTNKPLTSVLAELERTYSIRIVADPALLNHTISATFSNDLVTTITETLAAALNAKIKRTANGYFLQKK